MFEIDFLPVGTSNGDAICLRYGEPGAFHVHVVDGGYADTSQRIVDHIKANYGQGCFINHLVLSHADNDHASGLIGVMEQLRVDHLWMNRPWLYAPEVLQHFHGNYSLSGLVQQMRDRHPSLVQLEELALKQGTTVHEAFQGSSIGQFVVLAPSRARYIQLIPELERTPTSYRKALPTTGLLNAFLDAAKQWADEWWHIETLSNSPKPTSASNETSVVQQAIIEGRSILLTADVGPQGLSEAANYASLTGRLTLPQFIQVPHHGSRRNVTPAVLDRWLGPRKHEGSVHGTAFCSVGSDEPDYPRGQVKNAFQRRGYPVHVTRSVTKTHSFGIGLRAGSAPSMPEPFATRVDI